MQLMQYNDYEALNEEYDDIIEAEKTGTPQELKLITKGICTLSRTVIMQNEAPAPILVYDKQLYDAIHEMTDVLIVHMKKLSLEAKICSKMNRTINIITKSNRTNPKIN